MITLYDFPHGARGLRVAWLCEEMALPHAFVPVAYPPDAAYRALNRCRRLGCASSPAGATAAGFLSACGGAFKLATPV